MIAGDESTTDLGGTGDPLTRNWERDGVSHGGD